MQLLMCLNRSVPRWMPPYHRVTTTSTFRVFDFEHPDFSVPELPEAVIDPAHDAECKRLFP